MNNGQFESSTASQNISFIRHLCLTAAFFMSQGWPLYTGLTVLWKNSLVLAGLEHDKNYLLFFALTTRSWLLALLFSTAVTPLIKFVLIIFLHVQIAKACNKFTSNLNWKTFYQKINVSFITAITIFNMIQKIWISKLIFN